MSSIESEGSSVLKAIERNVVVYETELTISSPTIDDKFFDYTMADLKYRQKDLANQVLVEHNRPFISQNYLEQLNRERKHQCYKHCIIRFCIGGKVKLQAAFQSSEPVSQLFNLLADILKEDASNIELHFIHNKLQFSSTSSLLDAEIAPVGKIIVRPKELTVLEKWIAQIKGSAKNITPEEANQLCQDWLRVNTTYKPCEDALIVMESRMDNVNLKRSTDQNPENKNSGNMPFIPHHTPRAEFPKWFKSNQ
ncbi:ASPScr1 (ASPSCR1) like protein [Ditylenchus destructor]|uniref:ASPScr1 (ASPSCR1) like protein n=1 Tax=Ditylenchus destructor TaxID=166010 RepID=A0AAD4NH14_9BILA|nr:ASPScr1 (ASPSCR1) like protein [Ditylenchus destructor]